MSPWAFLTLPALTIANEPEIKGATELGPSSPFLPLFLLPKIIFFLPMITGNLFDLDAACKKEEHFAICTAHF